MGLSVFMADLTSAEIRELAASGTVTVIVPMGSIEAHGPHLPISTDCLVSQHLAGLLANRLGKCLVAPTISVAHAPRTVFPGTISCPVEVVVATVKAYCAAFQRDGFHTVILLPMHAESFQTIGLFATEIAREHPDLKLVQAMGAETLLELRNPIASRFGVSNEEAGWHAGAAETSEVMAINQQMVRTDRLFAGYLGPSGFSRAVPATLQHGWRALNERGIMGDARKATAELGERIFDALVDYLVEAVNEAQS